MKRDEAASEQDLVQRARAGDDDALTTLFDRHEAAMQRRIQALLPAAVQRRVAVANVLQDVRLVAFEKRGEFEWRGEGALRAWLLAIAERKARRAIQRHRDVALRSVRREVTRARRLGTDLYAGGAPSPSQAAVGAELADLARQAMDALAPDYHEVLRLCRQEELTLREAAERMGRSREATKKLYGRALARFTLVFNRLRGERDE